MSDGIRGHAAEIALLIRATDQISLANSPRQA